MSLRALSKIIVYGAAIGIVVLTAVGAFAWTTQARLAEQDSRLENLWAEANRFSARSDELLFGDVTDEELAAYVEEAASLRRRLSGWSGASRGMSAAVEAIDAMTAVAREHARQGAVDPDAPRVGPLRIPAPALTRMTRMATHGRTLDASLQELAAARQARARRIGGLVDTLSALTALGFALGALGVVVFMRRSVSEPLSTLTDIADRVAAGEEGLRTPVVGPAETRRLAAALNAALDRHARSKAGLAEANRELANQRQRMVEAQAIAELGSWWVEDDGTVVWSEGMYHVTGADPDAFEPGFETFMAMLAPNSRADLSEAREAATPGVPFESPLLRLRRPDGDVRIVRLRGVATGRASDGRVGVAEGIVQDVTESVAVERALEEERRLGEIAGRLARVGGWSIRLPDFELSWSDMVREIREVPPGHETDVESSIGFFAPWARPVVRDAVERGIADGRPYDLELELDTASGRRIWVRASGRPVRDADGSVVALEGALQDVDELVRARHERDRSLELRETLTAALPAEVALLDSDGTILEVNERWREYGRRQGNRDPGYGVGRNYLEIAHAAASSGLADAAVVARGLQEILDGDRDALSVEYACPSPEAERWFQLEARPVASTATGASRAVVMHIDVTESHQAREGLERLAYEDPLTGRLNRLGFAREFERLVADSWPSDHAVAVIDVRDMGAVNEMHGFDMGDALLRSVADRLYRSGLDITARLGGDEFAVLVGPDGTTDGDGAPADVSEAVRMLIREAVERVHELAPGVHVSVDAHVGLSRLGDRPRPAEELVREAQLALYEGLQASGPGPVWMEYARALEQEVHDRLEMVEALRAAISRDELRLHFHPEVHTRTGELFAAEALVRWEHPHRGLLGPGQFVPLAEATGLIIPLGTWVLDEACRKLATWRDKLGVTRVAVNVSAHELATGGYAEMVFETLARHDVEPAMLMLEVTETVFASAPKGVAQQLRVLRKRGVKVALDDFGTGYSSLAYLKSFPFDYIKIDRAFVSDVAHDPYSRAVITSVVAMARTLDATVVAEGVETEEARRILIELGCDLSQGFYYALPLGEEDFEWLLQTGLPLPLGTQT